MLCGLNCFRSQGCGFSFFFPHLFFCFNYPLFLVDEQNPVVLGIMSRYVSVMASEMKCSNRAPGWPLNRLAMGGTLDRVGRQDWVKE